MPMNHDDNNNHTDGSGHHEQSHSTTGNDSMQPSRKRSVSWGKIIGTSLETLFAVVLLSFGLALVFIPSLSPGETYTERTEGTVSEVGDFVCWDSTDDDRLWDYDGTMTITINVKGEEYSADLSDEKLCQVHEVGDTLDIWYDPNNPAKFGTSQGKPGGRYFIAAFAIVPGAIMTFFLCATFIANITSKIRKPSPTDEKRKA